MEGVSLVAGIEHIDILLAAVFTKEVCGFGMFAPDGSSWRRGTWSMQGLGLGYTPSLRPSIDLLYDIEQIINPSRLTKALAQFG